MLQPVQPQLSAVTQKPASSPESKDEALKKAATELEASFLAEMLKQAGFGEARQSFGGGIGEEQFSSFLREQQAQGMAKAGGIGLSEALFEAFKKGAPNGQ